MTLLVGVALGSGVGVLSVSASSQSWAGAAEEVGQRLNQQLPATYDASCAGTVQYVSIKGWGPPQKACVHGRVGEVRLARYSGSSGNLVYGIAYPVDTSFTLIKNFCVNKPLCAYSSSEDTLVEQSQASYGLAPYLIANFSQQLHRVDDIDGTYFELNPNVERRLLTSSEVRPVFKAIALSQNQRWAIMELEKYGYVRIDLRSLSHRWVVAPGNEYGYGVSPVLEMAITNSGDRIALGGWLVGLRLYNIDPVCGSTLDAAQEYRFSEQVGACAEPQVDPYALFEGFSSARQLHFSLGGSRLGLHITTQTGAYWTSIGPHSSDNSGTMVNTTYAAFGDSFTSGEGETDDAYYLAHTNSDGNKCHVSTRSYPYLAGADIGVVATNFACSGSRMEDVRMTIATAEASGVLEPPDFVTVGVGGNDLDIMGKLKTCLMPGTCEWVGSARKATTADEIKQLFQRLSVFFKQLKQEYGGARVVAVGYPSVVNTLSPQCGVLVSTLLSAEERQYLEESVRYLNQIIEAAAGYAMVEFVNTYEALMGERLCDPVEAAMNSIRLGDDIAPLSFLENFKFIGAESFHPTPRGHRLVANKVAETLLTPATYGAFSSSQLDAPSYWTRELYDADLGVVAGAPQQHTEFLSRTIASAGATVRYLFTAGTFASDASVRLELHSSPIVIETVTAAGDGSLEGSFTIPTVDDGYHTVHAFGVTPSGGAVDLYQSVAIGVPAETGSVETLDTPSSPGQPSTIPVLAAADNSETPITADLRRNTTLTTADAGLLAVAMPQDTMQNSSEGAVLGTSGTAPGTSAGNEVSAIHSKLLNIPIPSLLTISIAVLGCSLLCWLAWWWLGGKR